MEKVVLITGASSGIGKATAIYFAEKGWKVIATMRTATMLEDFIPFPQISILPLDISKDESIQSATTQVINKWGHLDVLVNNAGIAIMGIFEGVSNEQITKQFETNVFGAMKMTRAFLPHFRKNRKGCIINVSSIAGRMSFPLFSLYNASKFAIEGFSESIQYELNPFGIKVKIIEPGGVRTPFMKKSIEKINHPISEKYEEVISKIEKGYASDNSSLHSEPEDVASIIYEASISESSKLRYIVGKDAEKYYEELTDQGENTFFSNVKNRFNI